jgi:hypothetical protein
MWGKSGSVKGLAATQRDLLQPPSAHGAAIWFAIAERHVRSVQMQCRRADGTARAAASDDPR